jgi:hypothetical protein
MPMLRAILNGFMGDENSNTDCGDFTLFSCFENAKQCVCSGLKGIVGVLSKSRFGKLWIKA